MVAHLVLSLFATLLCWASLTTTAVAQPPKVDYLFPAGAARGQTANIKAGGKLETWPVQVWVDRPGLQISPTEEKGELQVVVDKETLPGLYWIRLFTPEGAATAQPFIVGTLPEVEEIEPNNAPSNPQELSSTSLVVNGRLGGTNDVDTFALALRAGDTLVAALDAHETLGSPMDAVLQVLSADGFVYLLQDDERGLDPLSIFTAPTDGVYLVRVFGFPATANQRISMAGAATFIYRLTLTTGGYVDRARPLAVNAKEPASVELDGWNIPDALRSVMPEVTEDGKRALAFQAELAQTVPLAIVDHAVVVETEPNTRATPQDVSLPLTVTGCIENEGDEDCFHIDATAGTTLDVRVESRELGYALDPVLLVLDAQGKVLKEVDDSSGSRDAQFDFVVPSDGPFTFVVRDLHREGGSRYMYRLSVSNAEPDFELTIGSELFSVEMGQTLDLEVTVARARNFAEPIVITAIDLPPGVSAAPATSAPEGDTAKKVVVKLQATDTPFSGPIKIEGRGESSHVHTATAALKVPRSRTDRLWLTVGPAKK